MVILNIPAKFSVKRLVDYIYEISIDKLYKYTAHARQRSAMPVYQKKAAVDATVEQVLECFS